MPVDIEFPEIIGILMVFVLRFSFNKSKSIGIWLRLDLFLSQDVLIMFQTY